MAIEEVHILHHTHVDIGYTDLQPVIWERHVEYLESVLALCRATDSYPEEAQFRWVCEFSWPMLQFFRTRPDRIGEMAERLREGRIELAALFVDPTELFDRRAYEMALRPAQEMAREHGFALTTVMTTDVPGMGWSLPDVLAAAGLPYLSVSPNAMVAKPLQLPAGPFYWIGPGGGRALVWHTDWRKGWYGAGHVLGLPEGPDVFAERLGEYLALLEAEGYSYRVFLLHYAADNYPPDPELADFVCAWNAAGRKPRLWLSTNRLFFERLRTWHGEEYPAYRAAWPDWWSEGLGSAAYETALARETQARFRRLEALQETIGEAQDLWPIWEDWLLFAEHTWGCSNMALEPHSYRSRASWIHKARHIYLAHDRARRLEEALLRQLGAAEGVKKVSDFCDLSVQAGTAGKRYIFFNPQWEAFAGPLRFAAWMERATGLQLASGECVPVQYSPPTALRPALGLTRVAIPARDCVFAEAIVEQGKEKPSVNAAGNRAEAASDASARTARMALSASGDDSDTGLRIENEFFRLEFSSSGRLLSLWDKKAARERLDPHAPWGFAEIIRETITSPGDRAAVWERGDREIPYGKRRTDANFCREGSLPKARLVRIETGPICQIGIVQSALPFVRQIETEFRLCEQQPWLELEIRLDKQAYELYESLYAAFSFQLEAPRAVIHSCDAVFEAEREQLPGTCRDFYAVQDFAALVGMEGWAAICPIEAPLVQCGALTFGRWADSLRLDRGALYSWLTNNFWYTNFPGFQLGWLTFRYVIMVGSGEFPLEQVARVAEEARIGISVGVVE